MRRNELYVFAGLILLLVIATGCGSFGRGRDEPAVSAAFAATGTEGLVMQFLQDQPPMKVYTQSPLTFLVEVRNKGTYPVSNAIFYLTGFDPGLLRGLPVSYPLTSPLEGKSQFNPEGGYTTIEFSTSTVNLPASMPNYKPTFMLTACYPYQTIATPLVCVDSNPLDQTSDKACRVQNVYSTGSQGAPLMVQSIESEARPKGMFFRIHVANTAGATEQASGTPFSLSSLGACPGGLQYSELNNIQYEVFLSGQPLECEPRGNIRLVNEKGTIFCKYMNMQQIPAYQTPLEVRLIYGYKSSISKVVEIENLNFGSGSFI